LPIGFWPSRPVRAACVVLATRWRDAATILADEKLYQRQIEATDQEIDALVYWLHESPRDETAIVRGRTTAQSETSLAGAGLRTAPT
jgi:hypothetical protein